MKSEFGGLDWTHVAASIPEHGIDIERRAAAGQLNALVQELGLLSCEGLAVRYTLKPLGERSYLLSGAVSADLVQACIVTLDPVAQHFEEAFRIEIRPPDEAAEATEREHEVLSETDIESFEGETIDVGRIVFGLLSTGLDPYPRKAGAEFRWSDPKADADKAAGGPFAALAKLKSSSE